MTILSLRPKQGDAFTFSLSAKRILIGHAPGNDIVLDDVFCSGIHAAIYPTKHGYAIQDQGSKNGTFLNGRRLEAAADLAQGDEILIGSTRVAFDRGLFPNVARVEEDTFALTSNKTIRVEDILRNEAAATFGTSAGRPGLPQRDQKIIAIMGEVSQALVCHMALTPLLDYVMDLITKNIPMDRGVLMLKEDKGLVDRVIRIQNAVLARQKMVISQSILRASLERNSSILISDVQSDRHLIEQESVIQARIHSAMCVPLWNNREIIGLIYVDRTDYVGGFSEEDLRLLTLLANLAAVKIENTRLVEASQEKALLEKELQMAVGIWRNLLPKCDPVFEPYDITGNVWPCRYIGGDYFDFIPIDHSRLGIVIADVSGHGVSAALLMAGLRSSLRAALPAITDLGLLAAALNDTIHSDSDDHTFISFFFGVLDRDKAEMSYVNAGHNPPLLVDSAGGVRFLQSTGLCLGMFPSVAYGTETCRIGPGETLCLYTDGIVEARNWKSEEFTVEGLVRQLRASADSTARGMLDSIQAGFSVFTECVEPGDDRTVVVVKSRDPGLGYSDRPEYKELRVPAELEELDLVRKFLRKNLQEIGVGEEDALKFEVALHEICTNVAMHAYPQERGEMGVRIWINGGKIYVETRDHGIPFNPAAEPPVDLASKIQLGARGGFGIFLFKTLMDGYSYERAGDENVLTMYRKL